MISVELENKKKSENSSYKDRYKTIYVATSDFAVAARVACKFADKFTVISLSVVGEAVLDSAGNPLC